MYGINDPFWAFPSETATDIFVCDQSIARAVVQVTSTVTEGDLNSPQGKNSGSLVVGQRPGQKLFHHGICPSLSCCSAATAFLVAFSYCLCDLQLCNCESFGWLQNK